MTEAQAIKHLENSRYGGLEQLALYLYSKTKDERKTFFNAEPTKQAALLDLPVEVTNALLNGPSFLAVAAPISKRQSYNLLVQSEIDDVMLSRMQNEETQLPHIVKARQYMDEAVGIATSDGSSRAGVSIVVNQQFNYSRGVFDNATGQPGQTLTSAEDAEDIPFTPLSAGGLPPEGVREDSTASSPYSGERPLFYKRES
jgi:hypothetical protein